MRVTQEIKSSLLWEEIRAGYLQRRQNSEKNGINIDTNSVSVKLDGITSTESIMDALDKIVNIAVASPSNYVPQNIPNFSRNGLVKNLVAEQGSTR